MLSMDQLSSSDRTRRVSRHPCAHPPHSTGPGVNDRSAEVVPVGTQCATHPIPRGAYSSSCLLVCLATDQLPGALAAAKHPEGPPTQAPSTRLTERVHGEPA